MLDSKENLPVDHHRCDPSVAEARAELERTEAKVHEAKAILIEAELAEKTAKEALEKAEHDQRHKLFVQVCTTSGFWPNEGFLPVPVSQPVEVILAEAKLELHIADVTNWVARVGDRVLTVSKSYQENGLEAGCDIIVDWGPDHGGGGCHA